MAVGGRPLVLPLRAVNSEPPASSGGSGTGRQQQQQPTTSPIHHPRRSNSALPTVGRVRASWDEGAAEDAGAYARPLLFLSRLSSGPGIGLCPVLLPDPPGLKAAEAAAAAAGPPYEAEGEIKEWAEPAAAAAAVAAARAKGWHHFLLMGCAACLPIGAVAGKAAVMAASVRLIDDLRMSKQMYGVVAGAPSLSTVLFSPLGGLVVDHMGADDAAAVFALVVLAGCVASTLGAALRSVGLLLAGQLLLGVGKPPLSVSQLVFLRLSAGPEGAGRVVAVANALFHLSAFLAFVAFPPLAALVNDRTAGGHPGDLVPLGASAVLALVSLLGALPLRGQLKKGRWKGEPQPQPQPQPDDKVEEAVDEEEEEEQQQPLREQEEVEERHGRTTTRPCWRHRLLHTLLAPSPACDEKEGTVHDRCGLRLLFLVMALFYGATMAFEAFAVAFLAAEGGLSAQRAAAATSVFEVGSIVLSPVVGRLADWDLHMRHHQQGQSQQQPRSSCWGRLRRLPSGSLQLSASALAALGILLPLADPRTWPAGFVLVSAGTATAGVAFWLSLPLFVCPRGLGRVVGTALALDEAGILLCNVAVGALVDLEGGDNYRKGALPFLATVAVAGTGASMLLVPRIGRAVRAEAEAEAAEGEGGVMMK